LPISSFALNLEELLYSKAFKNVEELEYGMKWNRRRMRIKKFIIAED
jgi:hypothetical protein